MPTPSLDTLFFPLRSDSIELPKRFTYPFYYQPHDIAVLASQHLQQRLLANKNWNTLFALSESGDLSDAQQSSRGKMFGVLIVKNAQGEVGYLSGFSGKIDDSNHHLGFVPPVYDMLDETSFFAEEMDTLNALHAKLNDLEADPTLPDLFSKLSTIEQQAKSEISALQANIVISRAERKRQRRRAEMSQQPQAIEELNQQLAQQSIVEKRALATLKADWKQKTEHIQSQVNECQQSLEHARQARAEQSHRLQHKLFAQYSFLNAQGEYKDLNQIFANTAYKVPPAGAGECAAPKLIQYAYAHGLTPIAMAEFWWGHSPKSEIRHHKQVYPSCMSKCHPILGHMLLGLEVDPDPLEENPAQHKSIEVIHQDEHFIVIHKPDGLLSVPGRKITDSAKTRVEALCPNADKVFVLHRLDMATSGLLVFALSQRANKHLQKQFITREVKKRYVALVQGELLEQNGQIDLPLCADPYDLPRQMVSSQDGKPALTHFSVVDHVDAFTKVTLEPHTGRTHQLRVHCAHKEGLNAPIVGDALYGQKSDRLYLHAEQLAFTHPITQHWVSFCREADF
jgi:tRNA pseudouridine32 synthase/23S rRNA pseudouridine746 synthase